MQWARGTDLDVCSYLLQEGGRGSGGAIQPAWIRSYDVLTTCFGASTPFRVEGSRLQSAEPDVLLVDGEIDPPYALSELM